MKKSWVGLLMNYMTCSPFYGASTVSKEVESEGGLQMAKRKPGGWKCMPYIIGNETFERVATFGLTANFTVYLVKNFHMEQVMAANLGNIFGGTTNFAPLVGAFISDAYWGRFRTLIYASIATFLSGLSEMHRTGTGATDGCDVWCSLWDGVTGRRFG